MTRMRTEEALFFLTNPRASFSPSNSFAAENGTPWILFHPWLLRGRFALTAEKDECLAILLAPCLLHPVEQITNCLTVTEGCQAHSMLVSLPFILPAFLCPVNTPGLVQDSFLKVSSVLKLHVLRTVLLEGCGSVKKPHIQSVYAWTFITSEPLVLGDFVF